MCNTESSPKFSKLKSSNLKLFSNKISCKSNLCFPPLSLKRTLVENKLQSEVMVLTDPDANSWVDKVNPTWSGAIPATVVKLPFYKG